MRTYKLILTWAADHRIGAIKQIRAATGLGLKEAKGAYDAITGLVGSPSWEQSAIFDPNLIPSNGVEILNSLDIHAATEKLTVLRNGGYADGRIEAVEILDANSELVLKLSYAIAYARLSDDSPSTIINAILAA